jgi:hypothetical protein
MMLAVMDFQGGLVVERLQGIEGVGKGREGIGHGDLQGKVFRDTGKIRA